MPGWRGWKGCLSKSKSSCPRHRLLRYERDCGDLAREEYMSVGVTRLQERHAPCSYRSHGKRCLVFLVCWWSGGKAPRFAASVGSHLNCAIASSVMPCTGVTQHHVHNRTRHIGCQTGASATRHSGLPVSCMPRIDPMRRHMGLAEGGEMGGVGRSTRNGEVRLGPCRPSSESRFCPHKMQK